MYYSIAACTHIFDFKYRYTHIAKRCKKLKIEQKQKAVQKY